MKAAKVFNTEEEAIQAVLTDEIVDGDVVVVRYVGPKGGPGMPEMLSLSSMIVGRRGNSGIINRRSLLRRNVWASSGHLHEAQDGGPIALLQTGDTVLIDQDTKELTMKVSEEELAKRQESLVIPPLHSRGALGKYAHIVSSSSKRSNHRFLEKR